MGWEVFKIESSRKKASISKKYFLIFYYLIGFFLSIDMMISYADDKKKDVFEGSIVFSEHKTAFYGDHTIKLLDISSRKEIDLGVKIYSYGYFYIVKSNCIGWINKDKIFIWDSSDDSIKEKTIHTHLPSPIFLMSLSPDGNKIAYLHAVGERLYIGGRPQEGQLLSSLGFKSELHVFDLLESKDYIVVDKAIDWEAPQWSPDGKKILYTRPNSNDYFDQPFLDRIKPQKDDSWKKLVQSTIFVYDFDKKKNYKLCSGIKPQWNLEGNKIAFMKENNKIGILNLVNNQIIELPIKEDTGGSFKIAWLSDDYLAYLGKAKITSRHSLLNFIKDLFQGYVRRSSLWIVKVDGSEEEYIGTKNFGDIGYISKNYKDLLINK